MKGGYFVVDADGHVRDNKEAIRPYVDLRFRNRRLIPRSNADRSVGGKFGKHHKDPRIQIDDMNIEGIDIMVL